MAKKKNEIQTPKPVEAQAGEDNAKNKKAQGGQAGDSASQGESNQANSPRGSGGDSPDNVSGSAAPTDLTEHQVAAILAAFEKEDDLAEVIKSPESEYNVEGEFFKGDVILQVIEKAAMEGEVFARETCVKYFTQNQALLPAILSEPFGHTELTLETGVLKVDNAELITWLQADETLNGILENLAGEILKQNGLTDVPVPETVEAPPSNNTLKMGL